MISAVNWNNIKMTIWKEFLRKKMLNEVKKMHLISIVCEMIMQLSIHTIFHFFCPLSSSCNKKSNWNSIWLNFLTTELGRYPVASTHSRLSFSNSKKLEDDSYWMNYDWDLSENSKEIDWYFYSYIHDWHKYSHHLIANHFFL